MTDAVETTDDVATDDVETDDSVGVDSEEADQVADPAAGLKKALDAERKLHKEAAKRAAALEQQLADKDKPADELAIETARREAREEVQKSANERIARLEVKAALAGKVSNPALALRLIDTSAIEVDADGEVDADAIDAAIATLLADAPELAVKAARFQGGADQGTKGKASAPAQLSKSDLSNMTPEQIVAASEAGQLTSLLKGT
ncbi:hypothetical protein [Microbacterium sp. LWH12-1.2]|uniref:hypothetical protein n=1 Tax=Microbacterium sp. LWH12-1.2 TaxID=3135259 RepID=UPI0034377F79